MADLPPSSDRARASSGAPHHVARIGSVRLGSAWVGSALFGAVALAVGSASATAVADASPDSAPTSGGTTVTVSLPALTSDRIAAGLFHTAVLAADGEIRAWGANWYGELGAGLPAASYSTPQQVVRPDGVARWTSVFAGPYETFAIGEDPGQVYAWGGNYGGELGLGSGGELIEFVDVPVAVDTSLAGGFTDIASGDAVTAAIDLDGRIWVWGTNTYGGLGLADVDLPPVHAPMPLPLSPEVPSGLRFVDVEAGTGAGFIALGEDGRVYGWGSNGDGRLGIGTTVDATSPVEVALPPSVRVASIGMGAYNGYAIDDDGAMWAWGMGFYGTIGDGTGIDRTTPVPVLVPASADPGLRWTEVVGGWIHTVARGDDGEWYAWGANDYGQLADGTVADRLRPERMSLAPGGLVGIGVNGMHTILATECGLLSVGANDYGELGNGTTLVITDAPPVPTALEEVATPLGSLELLEVRFDGTPGANPQQLDCDTWRLDAPPHAAGRVDLQLTYRSGPSIQPVAVLPGAFAYGTVPALTLEPLAASAGAGGTARFSAAAVGDTAPTAQWQVSSDGGGTWADLAGETADSLELHDIRLAQSGERYRVVYANGLGSVASTAAELVVVGPPAAAPGQGAAPTPVPAEPPAAVVLHGGGAFEALALRRVADRSAHESNASVETSLAVVSRPAISGLQLAAGALAALGGGLVVAHLLGRAGGTGLFRRR